jgi:hypothetical protein
VGGEDDGAELGDLVFEGVAKVGGPAGFAEYGEFAFSEFEFFDDLVPEVSAGGFEPGGSLDGHPRMIAFVLSLIGNEVLPLWVIAFRSC